MCTIKSVAKDMGVHTQAEGICNTFEKALSNFSKCHQGYSGGAMDEKAIDELGGCFCGSLTSISLVVLF